MDKLKTVAMILLIIGGLNWGLHGLFDMNLVTMVFDHGSMGAKIVYGAIGVAAVLKAWCWFSCCKGSCK